MIPPVPRPGLAAVMILLWSSAIGVAAPPVAPGSDLGLIRPGTLVWGADQEGGGPFLVPADDGSGELKGFEVDLVRALAARMGLRDRFRQGQWDSLLQNLRRGDVDIVVNGYEWTPDRAAQYLATRPYYLYELQLMARREDGLGSWSDLLERPWPGGRRPRVAVLAGSMAERFARSSGGDRVEVVTLPGTIEALRGVEQGRYEATLQDLPAARYYRPEFPGLDLAGPPMERGEYVIYVRRDHEALRDALDGALLALIASGDLRRIYETWDIWTDTQAELATWTPAGRPTDQSGGPSGWAVVGHYLPDLLRAALMTIVLAVCSFPPAMAIGLAVALVRLYGPTPLRWASIGYVELIRGTPLLLQLYVLFYLLPDLGILIPPVGAGIVGLAINYSAYEAEIYRAGLQAIPRGQMEAALSLGMSRGLALRRVIVPQAVRLVIPPVTSDFIALFKDTSVCSVIAITELTKQYSILANNYPNVVQVAIAAALLYLAMSIPLSWLSGWIERRTAIVGASR